jgi:hypothetical protein
MKKKPTDTNWRDRYRKHIEKYHYEIIYEDKYGIVKNLWPSCVGKFTNKRDASYRMKQQLKDTDCKYAAVVRVQHTIMEELK